MAYRYVTRQARTAHAVRMATLQAQAMQGAFVVGVGLALALVAGMGSAGIYFAVRMAFNFAAN